MVLKQFLAIGLSTCFVKDNPVFGSGPKSLLKYPLNCLILCNRVFDNFILAEKIFANGLKSFESCVLVNNYLCGKLFLSLESAIAFDESFRVTPKPLFVPDFNFVSSELDSCTFKVFY